MIAQIAPFLSKYDRSILVENGFFFPEEKDWPEKSGENVKTEEAHFSESDTALNKDHVIVARLHSILLSIAVFFESIGAQNELLRENMQSNTRKIMMVADALKVDPHQLISVTDGKPEEHVQLVAVRFLENASSLMAQIGKDNPDVSEQMFQVAIDYRALAIMVEGHVKEHLELSSDPDGPC